jgi:hypothetical protein
MSFPHPVSVCAEAEGRATVLKWCYGYNGGNRLGKKEGKKEHRQPTMRFFLLTFTSKLLCSETAIHAAVPSPKEDSNEGSTGSPSSHSDEPSLGPRRNHHYLRLHQFHRFEWEYRRSICNATYGCYANLMGTFHFARAYLSGMGEDRCTQ